MSDETPRGRSPALWAVVAIATCAITNYASYRKARLEAELTAAVSYKTLADGLHQLQTSFETHVKADEKKADDTDAEVDRLWKICLPGRTVAKPVLQKSHLSPKYAPVELPRTLEQAVQAAKQ